MDHAGLVEEFIEVIRPLAGRGRRAIALGGSRAKNRNDSHSDYDFRLYTDETTGAGLRQLAGWSAFAATTAKWEALGARIDGVWTRRIDDMEAVLDSWVSGRGQPDDYVWTIWGYHPLTDIANQTILEDRDGILAVWKERLSVYPPVLKRVLIARHLEILRYWRTDYHYRSKVARRDAVFIVGLSVKLVHSVMQVLFALNETYFPGDGWNLEMAAEFAVKPEDLLHRITSALCLGGPGEYERQYEGLASLIDDVEALAINAFSDRRERPEGGPR